MSWKPGDRVVAISSAGWKGEGAERRYAVRSFGEGTYRGRTVPEGDAITAQPNGMASMLAEFGSTNPTIDLDSGEVVYGCECWWGGIESARKQIGLGDPATVVEQVLPSTVRRER